MTQKAPVARSLEGKSLTDRLFSIFVFIFCALTFLVVAYPLYFIVIASFSNSNLVNQGKVVLFPKGFSVYGYEKIFEDTRIWRGYGNTILYTALGTIVNLVLTIPAAYALSRREFHARRYIMAAFVFTMFFSGGMVPTYMLMRDLKLIDKIWVMIIPFSVSVYNLIITRTFMETSIPEELYEAAMIDGCSHFRYFLRVVLPLSKAVISVICLYYLVARWNDFFTPLLYINSDHKQPLQTVLRTILLSNQVFNQGAGSAGEGMGSYAQQYADQIKYGVIIVSTAPVLCVYPFIQKYFEKGVMIGAVKG